MKNIRIIGLGLMGTNLGINLISKGIKVYGYDVNDFANKRANKLGIDTNNAEISARSSYCTTTALFSDSGEIR